MTDKFTPEKRSEIMSRVRSRDTKPEKIVRSMLHALGYRFRLCRRDLPGNPDIVLPKHRKAVFVHGCFWHGHKRCPRAKLPVANCGFWQTKLARNVERDRRNLKALAKLGWRTLVVWQCEMKDESELRRRLREFMSS